MTEREHKYLAVGDSYRRMASGVTRIAQGYLARTPERTVRVRTRGDRGYLTVKTRNVGDTRLEFEYEIPFADAEQLLSVCEGRIIMKKRYVVPFEGWEWEVDEFEGDLAPLVLCEIELPADFSGTYPLPPFAGRDVTGDPAFYNSNL